MRYIDGHAFGALIERLRASGYVVVAPIERDGTIRLEEVEGLADLARGRRETQGPGTYRLGQAEREDRFFAFSRGPDSAKRYLFPARERLERLRRDAAGRLEVANDDGPEPRYAFVGLRSCDLHAIAIQDGVFLTGPSPDPAYASRTASRFVVGVDCEEPGSTCFCASMGTGPACASGFDLALTEIDGGFLVRTGSDAGVAMLAGLDARDATTSEVAEARRITARATERMGRRLETDGLRDLLARNREHPRWDDVAARCLTCGNCTAVCPTCFCHDVVDLPDLLDGETDRIREWASCFSTEFSHTAGGDVRTSGAARYRQWLSHKFGSWWDQFATSGCVGCGRCITWCPVGIDVTAELAAIRETDGARRETEVAA